MRLLAALLVLMSLLVAPAAVRAQEGATILTVSGAIETANRGAFDAFDDGFLNYHGKTFEKAFAFDREALLALPQRTVTANAANWPDALEMSGPLLADVLAVAGAQGRPVVVYAMDGYGAAMSVERIAAHDWVLALEAGGKPLGIGGRGPAWLVYDTATGAATAEEEGAWVWSVFHIEVE